MAKRLHTPDSQQSSSSLSMPVCRGCLSKKKLLNMQTIVMLSDKSQTSILEMYQYCTKTTFLQLANYCHICQNCLAQFKNIYSFLKKCEKNVEILHEHTTNEIKKQIKKVLQSTELDTAFPTVTKKANGKNKRSSSSASMATTDNETLKHPHLCFVCGQSFPNYQALYKHNKVHRPMRCGGQECQYCRKKYFSEDTLKRHESVCGSLDNMFPMNGTDDTKCDENSVVMEENIIIKTEGITPNIEPNSAEYFDFHSTESHNDTESYADMQQPIDESSSVQFKIEVEDYV